MYKSVSDQILKFSNFKILRTLIFAASSIRVHLIVILENIYSIFNAWKIKKI